MLAFNNPFCYAAHLANSDTIPTIAQTVKQNLLMLIAYDRH